MKIATLLHTITENGVWHFQLQHNYNDTLVQLQDNCNTCFHDNSVYAIATTKLQHNCNTYLHDHSDYENATTSQHNHTMPLRYHTLHYTWVRVKVEPSIQPCATRSTIMPAMFATISCTIVIYNHKIATCKSVVATCSCTIATYKNTRITNTY